MKIKISYQADESEEADRLTEQLKNNNLLSGVKVTKSDRYAPFFHIYLATKNSRKPHK